MRVTRLEIFGFKSFVERFVLNFDKDMIGIVGPNGCGKSNVVDALRWVLGETHAKQLRGGSFEDLIFNGSDSRRPLGMAEVSLTIQPNENWYSENKLDNTDNKQLDNEITENFLEESDLENTDLENTALENTAEEKIDLHVESEKVLKERLSSIPGLFDSTEIQMTRRLYRSGESEYLINKIPCRLKDLLEVYRLIGLGARGLSIVQQGQIGQFISKKPSERRELIEEAAGISGFRSKIEAAERRLEKTTENLSRVNDLVVEIDKQVRSLRKQAQRARVRNQLKEELFNSDKNIFVNKAKKLSNNIIQVEKNKELISAELEELNGSYQELESQINSKEGTIHEHEVQILSIRAKRDSISRVLLEQEERLRNARNQVLEIENKINSTYSKKSDLNERRESIKIELSQNDSELSNIEEDKKVLGLELSNLNKKLEDLKNSNTESLKEFLEKNQIVSNQLIPNLNLSVSEIQDKIFSLEAEISEGHSLHEKATEISKSLKITERDRNELYKKTNRIKAEINAIDAQLDSLVTSSGITTSDSSGSEVLLSLLKVQPGKEKIVHASLGDYSNYLVSEKSDNLLKSYLESSTNNRKRVGVLSVNKTEKDLYAAQIEEKSKELGLTSVLDFVSYDSTYEEIIKSLLKYSFVANDISSALNFRDYINELPSFVYYQIILSSGEVLTSRGWHSTVGEGIHLSFARNRSMLSDQLSVLEEEYSIQESNFSSLEKELSDIRHSIQEHNTKRDTVSKLQKELSIVVQKQNEEERIRTQEFHKKERDFREELRRSEDEIVKNIRDLESKILTFSTKIEYLKKRSEQINSSYKDLDSKESEIEELLVSYQEELSNKLRAEKDIISISENNMSSSSFKEDLIEIDQKISELESVRLSLTDENGSLKSKLSEVRRRKDELFREDLSLTSGHEKSTIELSYLEEDFKRNYPEIIIEDFLKESEEVVLLEGSELESLVNNSQSIRKRLEREGEVDPESIRLCEEEEQRLLHMTNSRDDLLKAKDTLNETIKFLKSMSRERFVNTFNFVSKTFETLVPRLFSGGSGKLELINADDPLQSGVEVMVRPPGKKLSSMELMSGGEKALVATAVLVSLFLHHPGPICVLDEVDAPLDDANLERFLELVREISSRTQFLIITHNKVSMQAVDRLIGITMQESGVTKAISVDLKQAEEEILKDILDGNIQSINKASNTAESLVQ